MNLRTICLFTFALAAALPAQKVAREGPPLSPFRAMRDVDDGIEVQVDSDTWFELQSIDGVDTGTLLREAKRLCGRQAWKRLTEDLPALLDAMGHRPGDTVDLVLRDLATGAVEERQAVPMTAENRRLLWQANQLREPRLPMLGGLFDRKITTVDARADLATLRDLLDTRFAYRTLRDVDLEALLHEAEHELAGDGIAAAEFARLVDRILRAFGDGHSRVVGVPPAAPLFLPFLVQQVDGGHVAFRSDRSGFVDAAHPFVVAIDGVPLERWLDAARARGTQGSSAMQAREAERGLREIAELQRALGLPLAETVRVRLRGESGATDLELPIAVDRPVYGAWPRTATRRLDGDLGYLRLPQMDDDARFLDGLDEAMQSFRDTRGLVIDVRGNGGGTRDALRRLAPYFLPADGTPVVGNVAAVLLEDGRAAGIDALADRGLYPAEWTGWTEAQRAAITTFARTFRPGWKLPQGRFSPWHFLVLDRADNGNAFAYGQPVVVLIDRSCFSATDVFAAALGELPNVRLVGEPTSGGSGRARGYVLPKSGVRLRLSTMASFRPDGVLFEGHGVEPDIAVGMRPGDLVGATDTVLQRALDLLR
jgi:hypothetical protein